LIVKQDRIGLKVYNYYIQDFLYSIIIQKFVFGRSIL